jgi:hypothetical protein
MVGLRSVRTVVPGTMGRTVPTVRQLMNEEYQEWIKMAKMLPVEERKALKELLDAALTRSDAGSIVPRVIPSETMFMLMLVHLKAKVNELEAHIPQRLPEGRACHSPP